MDLSPDGQHQGTSVTPKPRLSRNAEDNKYMPVDARTWSEGFRMLFPWILIIVMSIITGALVSFYLVGCEVCSADCSRDDDRCKPTGESGHKSHCKPTGLIVG